jgi:hypothetical protein
MRKDKAFDAVCDRMYVRSAKSPLRYMLDGDLHQAQAEVEVTIATRVRLLNLRGQHPRANAGVP